MKRKGKAAKPVPTTVTQEQIKLLALAEQGGVHRGATSWYLEHRPAKQWDAEDLEILQRRHWITWERPDRAMDHGMAAPVDITPEGRAALQHHLPGWVHGRKAIAAPPPRMPAVETIKVLDALQ
ncbi:hypothetical protein UK23_00225 [Lentzea aerocolonigenes]|uniref:Uncharacterized protein n=1 Tax=Lentzea aerocolonigenes TaxID=68170 RepID=A0A0F0HF43_LENAE|nr:hypothetical protein [Lentzea aerocolonigenes]KJK53461.1 hypothetical protein UK23_00225 [Lentzea aerocolonigenes]